jgi:hypothetical protein
MQGQDLSEDWQEEQRELKTRKRFLKKETDAKR